MTAAHLPASAQAILAPKLTAAFMDGFHRGCLVAAAMAVVVAVIVFCYLPTAETTSKSEFALER